MPPLTPDQQARVRAKLVAERQAARAALAEAQREHRNAEVVAAAADAAEQQRWQAYLPHDDTGTAVAAELHAAWWQASEAQSRAHSNVWAWYDRTKRLARDVAALYAPDELGRRLGVREANEEKFAHLRNRAGA